MLLGSDAVLLCWRSATMWAKCLFSSLLFLLRRNTGGGGSGSTGQAGGSPFANMKPFLGLSLSENYGDGVRVTRVTYGGPAADSGLRVSLFFFFFCEG